jgi:hypothetical protein
MGLFKLDTVDEVYSLKEVKNKFLLTEIDFTIPPIAVTCDLTSILCDTTMTTCDAI